jgi:predicted aspartyl protease
MGRWQICGCCSQTRISRDGKRERRLCRSCAVQEAITLNAVIDSGAADVSIPADIVSTLIRAKTLSEQDFLGVQTYVLADGTEVPSPRFRIRSLKVGNTTLENVSASVASGNADILLGQSFLGRFKSWSVDNDRHVLILR